MGSWTRFKTMGRGGSWAACGKSLSMQSPSAITTAQSTGLMTSTIVVRTQLVWKKFGQQNGGPINTITFLLLVAEVNAVQTWVHGKKETAMPRLEICKKLAMRMMPNNLNDDGVAATSPMCTWSHTPSEHVFLKWKQREGKWNQYTCTFTKQDTLYIPHPCSEFHAKTQSYCKCDPGCPLGMVCFGIHAHKHGG